MWHVFLCFRQSAYCESIIIFTFNSHWPLKYFPLFWLAFLVTLILWHSIEICRKLSLCETLAIQALVVWGVDNTIHYMNLYPNLIMQYILLTLICWIGIYLATVVWRLDSAIHWIILYWVDNAVGFAITYPLDGNFIPWIALSALYTTGPRFVS